MANLFLLQENGGFLLQENGGKLIIGEIPDVEGGGSGGKSTQFGVSAVKKQLGLRPTEKFVGLVKGKLLIQSLSKVVSKVVADRRTPKGIVLSKLSSKESCVIHSRLHTKEVFRSKSKILRKEYCITKCEVLKHPSVKLSESVETLSKIVMRQNEIQKESMQREERIVLETMANVKNEKREKLLQLQKTLQEDIRKVPSIQVTLNTDIHQRGDLMRITANMSDKTGQIWMRIIDSKGMIVQKAGMVKKNATGFQILVGTKDLKAGGYTVQISNHPNFSPLGVAEFKVKQNDTPLILPFIPLLPFTDPNTGLPADANQLKKNIIDQKTIDPFLKQTKKDEPKDTLKDEPPKLNEPTQTKLPEPKSPKALFSKVIFKTMMDSRVDAICKVFENKVFRIDDKNLPVPPIHFNCRCHLEGKDE